MPIRLNEFSEPGSTPARKKFWADVLRAVSASQKLAGRNVSVQEYAGHGSVINVADYRRIGTHSSGPPPPILVLGACCFPDGTCNLESAAQCVRDNGVFHGVGSVCSPNPCPPGGACCFPDGRCNIETSSQCSADGGTYHGDGTICSPNPCPQPTPTGACCVGTTCSITTSADCTGIYQGDGTLCTPNPCCTCGFAAFDGSGRRFFTYQRTISGHSTHTESNSCAPPNDSSLQVDAHCSANFQQHYPTDCSTGAVTDLDTSSSDHTITTNGVVTETCSRPDIQCFCDSVAPFNQCSDFNLPGYQSCNNCTGGDTSSDNTVSTVTTRTRTVTFAISCTQGCTACANCVTTCHVSGSYVVTETLSNECV